MGDDNIAGNGMANAMAPRARDFRSEPFDALPRSVNGAAMKTHISH